MLTVDVVVCVCAVVGLSAVVVWVFVKYFMEIRALWGVFSGGLLDDLCRDLSDFLPPVPSVLTFYRLTVDPTTGLRVRYGTMQAVRCDLDARLIEALVAHNGVTVDVVGLAVERDGAVTERRSQ